MHQFKFYDDKKDRAGLFAEEADLVPVPLLRAHMDPFYNECRAFGKIVESELNGKVAVKCYGYLTVSVRREKELQRKFNVDN